MTSPIGFLLPPDRGRIYRDYSSASSPSRAALQRNITEYSMDGTNSLEHVRTKDGQSAASPALRVPQRRLVLPDPLAFR